MAKKSKDGSREKEKQNAQRYIEKYGKKDPEGAKRAQDRINNINSGAARGGGDARTPQQKALDDLWGKKGTAAGDALVDKLGLQGQFLGRVDEQVPGQREYLDKLKGGLDGYTSPEYQAQREQMQQGLNSQYATASGQLAKAQARGRVYGAAGAAQAANLSQANLASKNDLEQKLMVQNINERQNRLNNYGEQNAAAEAANLERTKLNQGNNAAEIATRAETLTGAGGVAISNRENEKAREIQMKALKGLRR